MRVLSGRLKAVLVATLATIVLVGVLGPATTLASQPARSGALHVRHGPGRIRRQLLRPERLVRRLRQVPDHALELAVVGARATSATPVRGRRRPTRRSSRPASSAACTRPRQLAPRRLLVADRVEPDDGLVGLRDQLRQQGHGRSTGARPRRPRARERLRRRRHAASKAPASGRRRPRRQPIATPRRARRSPTRGTWRTAGFRGYAGNAAKYVDEGRRHRDVRVQRLEGRLVRPGRADPRQGQGPRRRDVRRRPWTSTRVRSRRGRPSSARAGRRPARTRSTSRSSAPPATRTSRSTASRSSTSGRRSPRSRPGSPRPGRSRPPSPWSAAPSGSIRGRPC